MMEFPRKGAVRVAGVLLFAGALCMGAQGAADAADASAHEKADVQAEGMQAEGILQAIDPRDFEGFVWRLDSAGKTELPRHFRTAQDAFHAPAKRFHLAAGYVPSREGLDSLSISGSAAFTPAQLKNVVAKLREKTAGPIYDVDLRQESHGFLDDIPVSWYGRRDWANIGKSHGAVRADERRRLRAACGHTAYIASLDKHKLPKGGTVRRVMRYATEREVAEAAGMRYVRITATDHVWPSAEEIDRFIRFYRTVPKDAWLHFHCEAGVGRTTAFMVMTDMMRNPGVPLGDILCREHEIGGFYYGAYPIEAGSDADWKTPYYEEKVRMMAHFYQYVQACHADGYRTSWSSWLKAHPPIEPVSEAGGSGFGEARRK